MPQDTTIYWDGEGQLPPLIDSLPLQQQKAILHRIHDHKWDEHYSNPMDLAPGFVVLAIFILFFSIAAIRSNKKTSSESDDNNILPGGHNLYPEGVQFANPVHTYRGSDLNFSLPEMSHILQKHSAYYNGLNPFDKEKFIQRTRKFITQISFVIHDKSGFKEMPVLISAAAIQLTFGLEKYLLPDFDYIHIYPEEFIGVHPTVRVLEGNVSGNTINLSWKHFLHGFQCPDDGQNVGLHEMAHAYYYQFFETGRQADKNFVAAFPAFNNYGNKVFQQEAIPGFDLYSDYALKNFQEFWAENIEIFFEKPAALRAHYPDLYYTICTLLNQYPNAKT
ncbi:MAG: zinc-dependent peptidase [Ferruginibacter sp.]|uniref:zinc-dependent peptidase n=1 Tax=Ferruginibacter sp. TaxID=1940288 RepID=UPI0026584076|nr:zinc-dependent peptidase [Ferruginibacter sp.]MDB5277899.1 zinc-dependent peptidase [Ferruginibacter sp.]